MIDALYRFLDSVGFTDPIHAPLTHMPIGLVTTALVFFLIAIALRRNNFVLTAKHLVVAAFIFAFPTILFGVFDWVHYYGAALIRPIKIKMILAGSLLVVLAAGIILSGERRAGHPVMLVIYLPAFLIVTGLGFFGGSIVFGGGITPVSSGPQQVAQTAPETQTGEQIFASNCRMCHPGGGNVVDPAHPLIAGPELGDENQFIAFIHNPVLPDGTRGPMPAFSATKINNEEAHELFVYINEMITAKKWR